VSLVKTDMAAIGVSSFVLAISFTAVGGSFTGWIERVIVAVLLSRLPSLTLKVKVSLPL